MASPSVTMSDPFAQIGLLKPAHSTLVPSITAQNMSGPEPHAGSRR